MNVSFYGKHCFVDRHNLDFKMGRQLKSNNQLSQKRNKLSRKELRKQIRKEKKAKRNEYFKNKKKVQLMKNAEEEIKEKESKNTSKSKNILINEGESTKTSKTVTKPNSTILDEQNKLNKEEKREKAKLERGMMKQRKITLMEANKKEDKEIKKLEKQLKLNKRKSKSVPKSFIDEGLDYLLEVCDSDKLMDSANAEMNLQESESEFQDDLAVITGSGKRKLKSKKEMSKNKKKADLNSQEILSSDSSFSDESEDSEVEISQSENEVTGSEDIEKPNKTVRKNKSNHNKMEDEADRGGEIEESSDDGYSDIADDDEIGSNSLGSEDEIDNFDEENEISNSRHKELYKKKTGFHEDIYGRLRDSKGNIIQTEEKGKYVPPHLRAQNLGEDAKRSVELARLKKQLKGLINRLAESNIHSIANQIDELYQRNSRNDMNDTLLSLITEALVSPVLTADRLVMEHALLITVLHANVGMEIGAHFLEAFVLKFYSMYKNVQGENVESKELDDILLIISHLYNFKVFHSVLMYNILNLLTERFFEKEVELILLVLRSVGFNLRKDDPLALKDLVLRLQKKASEATQLKDNTRVRFMLDVLLAVKNNNMAKIPQYDPSLSEHLKKLLKTLVRKGKYVTELKITLDDFLKVEERGRWWIVGSAWTGTSSSLTSTSQNSKVQDTPFSQSVLELARKQRMNTDTRRNIFCILMTAEDYLDAFEKLLRLGLKPQQEQEIVHVMVHCLQQEKKYNPYYAVLATHFCQADRRHQMSIQYHLWDKFKELSNMSQSQITNLAKFIAHLFLEKALPISVLKVMQFSEMDKSCVRLLRQILLSLLLSDSEEPLVSVFTRVSRPEKLHMFRESLRLFLHHFVLRNVSDLPPEQELLLKNRVRLAETSLTSADTKKFL